MLLGEELTAFPYPKNSTYENLQTQRVLTWRLFLEEYDQKIEHIEDENVIADIFFRLGRVDNTESWAGKNNAPYKWD